MHFSESIFASTFALSRLSEGGDYAALYFEYLLTSSIKIDRMTVGGRA